MGDASAETSPTPYTRELVYNAWWFELLMLLLIVNFMGNIKKYNLLSREKISVLILHLSFIFILLGALVTRYIGDEGVMPIRENTTSNTYLSEKTYLNVFIDGERNGLPERKTLKPQQLLLSEHTNNNFKIKDDKISVSLLWILWKMLQRDLLLMNPVETLS